MYVPIRTGQRIRAQGTPGCTDRQPFRPYGVCASMRTGTEPPENDALNDCARLRRRRDSTLSQSCPSITFVCRKAGQVLAPRTVG